MIQNDKESKEQERPSFFVAVNIRTPLSYLIELSKTPLFLDYKETGFELGSVICVK